LTTLGGGTITGGSPTGNAILVSLVGGSLAGDEEITLTPSGTGKLSKGASSVARTPDTFAAAATVFDSYPSADITKDAPLAALIVNVPSELAEVPVLVPLT
jgi:hypothetical protein